jgi:hypothetical protein
MVWAPTSTLAQTPEPSTGSGGTSTDSVSGQADVADLPVCGQPVTSAAPRSTSPAASSRSRARRSTRAKRTRTANRRTARRKRGSRKTATEVRRGGLSTSEDQVRGTLTLDQEDQETVTAAVFGRSTEPQPLTLVYRVTGCRVTDALPWPRSPLPTGPVNTTGARALPLGSVQIDDVDADGDRYVVYLRVFVSSRKASEQGGVSKPAPVITPSTSGGQPTGSSDGATSDDGTADTAATASPSPPEPAPESTATSPPDTFNIDPGSYTSFVRIKASWSRTVATPVTVTRSEDSEWIPLGVGVVGGLCGFFVFWLLRKIHDDDLMVKETWVLWLAAIVSVVVGAGTAFITNYINQDVWTLEANGLALFIAAFSASTGGVAAGLLTGIYKTSVANAAGDGSGGANSGGGGTEPSAGAHA